MRIVVNEPATGSRLELNAVPEDYNGDQGWRILSPDKDSFVIVEKNGDWHVADETGIHPELIQAIGKALQPKARYNSVS